MANKRFIFNWHRNEKYSNPMKDWSLDLSPGMLKLSKEEDK